MYLELTDEQAEALIRGLRKLIDGDRYPLSPRIAVRRGILAKLRPEPVREPLPPLKTYAPPRGQAQPGGAEVRCQLLKPACSEEGAGSPSR
jgi:hypothetical protein